MLKVAQDAFEHRMATDAFQTLQPMADGMNHAGILAAIGRKTNRQWRRHAVFYNIQIASKQLVGTGPDFLLWAWIGLCPDNTNISLF